MATAPAPPASPSGTPQQKKPGLLDAVKSLASSASPTPQHKELLPQDRTRWWEFSLQVRSFSITSDAQLTCFFCVSVGPEEKKSVGKIRLMPHYTPITTLIRKQEYVPINPMVLYSRKTFALSYKAMEKHVVKIDMWKACWWTFNEYVGYRKQKLSWISERDPHIEFMMKKKLSKKVLEQGTRAQRQQVGDVARFNCTVSLEEIFDFKLVLDNWTLVLHNEHKKKDSASNDAARVRKRLTFLMPKDRRSLPGMHRFSAGSVTSMTTNWNVDQAKTFWAQCGTFVFRGTRTHLRNSFFVVIVRSGSPLDAVLARPKVQSLVRVLESLVGRALMNLTSVLDISVFKGQVKAFKEEESDYRVGELGGNVECIIRSKGLGEEPDFRTKRPEQVVGASTVTGLKKEERFLVVRVWKCESLPVADLDASSSNPMLRVSWDNMVMTSATIPNTLRPVFHESFYFPVRMVFPELTRYKAEERPKTKKILKHELVGKGEIKIEVWHNDITSMDHLGGHNLMLSEILAVRGLEKRSLLAKKKGSTKAEKEKEAEAAEADEDEPQDTGKPQWYEENREIRVYDGSKTMLTCFQYQSTNAALIHFEAYFWPDFAPTFTLPEPKQDEETEHAWKKKEIEWNKTNEAFQKDYAAAFPDSIGARKSKEDPFVKGEPVRRFLCTAMHTQRIDECPLMSFLSSIIVPKEYSLPAKLLHWVYCLSFETSTKQNRTGNIPADGWKDPAFVMARHKGATQDHAILLCALLLGCKRDAYVCKGTVLVREEPVGPIIPGVTPPEPKEMLMEHAWVMTREDSWVTFWEPCSRQVFHLKDRYTPPDPRESSARNRKKKGQKGAIDEEDNGATEEAEGGGGEDQVEALDQQDDEDADKPSASVWDGEVADARISIQDMEHLPTVGRQPKPKMRSGNKKKEKENREQRKAEATRGREQMAIAPVADFLTDQKLVQWLPYDSIEVVFNAKNLWANRQNHHPACINYDLPENDEKAPKGYDESYWHGKWEPLIKKKDEGLVIDCISPNVSIAPATPANIVDRLTYDLKMEVQQNLYLYRTKKRGVDTYFETSNPELSKIIMEFINIQEKWLQIDPDSPDVGTLLQGADAEAARAQQQKDKPTDETKPVGDKGGTTVNKDARVSEFIRMNLGRKDWGHRESDLMCSGKEISAAELANKEREDDDPSFGEGVRQWNKLGSPFFDERLQHYASYRESQAQEWTELNRMVSDFIKSWDAFPIKRGKTFRGFPVHFSTPDCELIRTYLMELPLYRKFIDMGGDADTDDVTYSIEVKMFPLLGGILSVWLYIGIQESQREDPPDPAATS
eukprot:TRINITY_DN22798_c0_g1_i1.p1 TRINITY_DN22798_c0_g1~~TRINITY_DN22798_c0_g1_i1.p1  ORF type:complete len:1315 (-),score=263.21 TRINITY_DN22798_c0_g1_i1:111-4055(-)